MKANRSVLPMKAAKGGYIVFSVLFCLLGGLLLAQPDVSIRLFGRCLGGSMVLFGLGKLVGYFSRDLFRLAFQYDLALGILTAALGVLALVRSEPSLRFLCVMLGISVLADGLFKLQIALDSRPFGIGRWWLILALAVLTGGLGALLLFRPGAGTRLLAALLGLSLLSEGVLNLCVALCTVKIIAHQKPDVVEADFQVSDHPTRKD